MRKVIDHGNAVYFAANFTAPADALKSGKSLGDRRAPNAPGIGGNDRGERVQHIKRSNQRRLETGPFATVAENTKARQPSRVINVTRLPARLSAGAESFHLRKKRSTHLTN